MTPSSGPAAMRDLRGLLATAEGRALLHDAGIFTGQARFLAAIRPPRHRLPMLGPQPCLVYLHQQPSPDPRVSVVRKFVALAALQDARPDLLPGIYLAIDTDRAASSKAATRIAWQDATGRRHALKVTPPRTEVLEFRHFPTGPRQLAGVAATLEAYLRQSPPGRDAWPGRLRALRPHLAPVGPTPYGDYAAGLGEALLGWHLGIRPARVCVSCLTGTEEFQRALTALLRRLDDFIRSYNRSIARWHALGVSTAVEARPDDHLPLFYACPVDGQRLRRQRSGGECLAVAVSRAGRGSALYLLVQGVTMREALGLRPLPVLVPESLAEPDQGPPGLLQRWLMGAAGPDGLDA